MATKYECDRCHTQSTVSNDLTRFSDLNGLTKIELCGKCMNAFKEFMKNFSATTAVVNIDVKK